MPNSWLLKTSCQKPLRSKGIRLGIAVEQVWESDPKTWCDRLPRTVELVVFEVRSHEQPQRPPRARERAPAGRHSGPA